MGRLSALNSTVRLNFNSRIYWFFYRWTDNQLSCERSGNQIEVANFMAFSPEHRIEEVASPGNVRGTVLTFRVRGDSHLPAFSDGDIICCSEPIHSVPLTGIPCVVKDHSGNHYLTRPNHCFAATARWVATIVIILKSTPRILVFLLTVH